MMLCNLKDKVWEEASRKTGCGPLSLLGGKWGWATLGQVGLQLRTAQESRFELLMKKH